MNAEGRKLNAMESSHVHTATYIVTVSDLKRCSLGALAPLGHTNG